MWCGLSGVQVRQSLGPSNDIEAGTKALLAQEGVVEEDFSLEVSRTTCLGEAWLAHTATPGGEGCSLPPGWKGCSLPSSHVPYLATGGPVPVVEGC